MLALVGGNNGCKAGMVEVLDATDVLGVNESAGLGVNFSLPAVLQTFVVGLIMVILTPLLCGNATSEDC